MERKKRGNILFIMTDEQKFDAISGLSQIPDLTPNLEALAQDGVQFANAYTPSPVCGPARAAIFSGLYPPASGVAKNWSPFAPGVQMMTTRLQACGYETAEIGKLHFVPSTDDFGFEYKRLHDAPYSVYAGDDKESAYIQWLQKQEPFASGASPVAQFDEDELSFNTDIRKFMLGSSFRTEEQHDVAWSGRECVDFLKNREDSRPFFMFLSFFGPHMPYGPPAPYDTMFDWHDIELPESYREDFLKNGAIFSRMSAELRARILNELTEDDAKQVMAAYFGQVKMVDDYVGKVVAQLKESGQYDDTTIIFTSDHGDHMGSYGLFFKGQMYDSSCKVPLVIKPAGGQAGGKKTGLVVNTLDLYGTILDIAGDRGWRQPGIEARSLLPMLGDEALLWDNHTFSIIGGDRDEALSMLRRGQYKLCRLGDGKGGAYYEMFDLEADPLEHKDVADDPAYAKVRALMQRELDDWFWYQHANYPAEVTTVRSDVQSFNGVKNL